MTGTDASISSPIRLDRVPSPTPGDKHLRETRSREIETRGRIRLTVEAEGYEQEALLRLAEALERRGIDLSVEHLEPTRITEETEAMRFLAAYFSERTEPVLASVVIAEAARQKPRISKSQLRRAHARLRMRREGNGRATRWYRWEESVVAESIDGLLGDSGSVEAEAPSALVVAARDLNEAAG